MQMLSCPKASRNPFKHLGLRLWVSHSSQNVQPGVNKQKWTKHPVFNLAAECSGQAVFLTVGQKCFNWEPCFESSWVVLKMKRCSSFSHTRDFCERHSGILTRTTLLSWRTPSTLCLLMAALFVLSEVGLQWPQQNDEARNCRIAASY